MLQSVSINFVAVVVAAIVSMALGAFWYSPAGFGKQWMKLSGLNPKQLEAAKKKRMGKTYAVAFLASLIMADVLAYIVDYAEASTVVDGLQVGFWVWLGFVATVSLGLVLWENKPIKLWVLNNAYNLITLMLMASILTVWV